MGRLGKRGELNTKVKRRKRGAFCRWDVWEKIYKYSPLDIVGQHPHFDRQTILVETVQVATAVRSSFFRCGLLRAAIGTATLSWNEFTL